MTRPEALRRRSLRLPGFDYGSPGAYFVTICTRDRACILGEFVEGEVRLTSCGLVVQEEWLRTPTRRPYVSLDEYVIMPNHIHGIVILTDRVGATRRVAPTDPVHSGPFPGSIGAIIGLFKSAATRRSRTLLGQPKVALWQRVYYEHIIRDAQDMHRIRAYIQENPLRWALDEENPARTSAAADR